MADFKDRVTGKGSDLRINAAPKHGTILDSKGRRVRTATEREARVWMKTGELTINGESFRVVLPPPTKPID